MITKTAGYASSDGTIHGSLEQAQKAELNLLLDSKIDVDMIFSNKDKIIDILTTTSSSKPKARRIHGGTKTRAKKSARHEAEQFPMRFEDNNKPAA